jgi:uncharacterized protein
MEGSVLQQRLKEEMKAAMRAQEKKRLLVIRLILSSCKQVEVDERIVLDDVRVLSILTKMIKQRRESISQFQAGKRDDLVQIEEDELAIIQEFLPEPLKPEEIEHYIEEALEQTGASTIKDLSKVVSLLKPRCEGRVDFGQVMSVLKQRLSTPAS